jgi:GntR family transcriptional regulator
MSPRLDLKEFATRKEWVAADLRQRVDAREWGTGERLPSEHTLMSEYSVSRATIRTALQTLEGLGFTSSVRGSGTFVLGRADDLGAIDLRRLESLSATLSRHGYAPSIEYRCVEVSGASERVASRLALSGGEPVLAAARALRADGEIVAFSYIVIPLEFLGPEFEPEMLTGSIFDLLKSRGIEVVVAHTGLHVASGPDIGWGEVDEATLYLLLDEIQMDYTGRRVLHAETYFVEGRFNFAITRTR